MRSLSFIVTFLGVLSATILVVILFQLIETRSNLATTKAELGSVQADRDQLSSDLGTTRGQLTAKIAENEALIRDLAATTEQLTNQTAENESLTTNLATTTERLVSKTAEAETLLETTTGQLATLWLKTAENETLTADLETTTEQLATKIADNETLLSEVGHLNEVRNERDALLTQKDSLNSQINSLQVEIASLKGQRAPFIVETYAGTFACTGSMEPKITCLDSATWLANFTPQDVVIGTVISFTPTVECNLSGSGRVAHRVVDIRMEANIYYYWPRGDANSQDDGCWIPHANVNGYIIDLQKNTHPENQALREKVNSSKAARDLALQNYEEKEAAYDQKRLFYCGSVAGTCTLQEPYYSELTQLYNELNSLYNTYLNAYNTWELAYNEAIA
ncbi:MAG: hypothetical protein O2783_03170 [Chloroflexi bacterium]|nr:hypothetical protein [Chloroflexota bacterium]